jgi:hypothetical protein
VTLEQAIFGWANEQTEIVALLGEPARLRLFKLTVPQRAHMPSSVLQRTGTQRQQLQCRTDRTVQATLQFDHYGKSQQVAAEVAEVFRLALHAIVFPVMMGGVKVKDAFLVNEFDLDDPEPGLYRRSQSWRFWYVE